MVMEEEHISPIDKSRKIADLMVEHCKDEILASELFKLIADLPIEEINDMYKSILHKIENPEIFGLKTK